MGTINLSLPVAGTNISAGLHSSNYAALQTLLNGGLDAANLAADSVGVSEIIGGLAGQVLRGTGPTWEYPPGHEFGYAEFTASVDVTTNVEASANTIVTAPAITFDGSTKVAIEFFGPIVESPVAAGDQVILILFEDGVSIGHLSYIRTPAAAAMQVPQHLVRQRTPASGSRTYSVRAIRFGATNGKVWAGAGGSGTIMPGYIRITKAN